jgi:hypothetical protein
MSLPRTCLECRQGIVLDLSVYPRVTWTISLEMVTLSYRKSVNSLRTFMLRRLNDENLVTELCSVF